MGEYFGYSTVLLTSSDLQLDCLSTAGPRIVRLSYKGSPNLLAEVPTITHTSSYGEYRYLGGHRLWHSPEASPRSYIPDLEGLTLAEVPGGVTLEGKLEAGTGIRKRLEIRLDPDRPAAVLTHTLTNEGLWGVELAPWALTMFRLGGTLILPIHGDSYDKDELLPNRHISLWPYSRTADPRLTLEDEFILLQAKPGFPPFKIGTFNPPGWIAYWLNGILFRKTFEVHPGAAYPDFGCNAESYTDSYFIELESLGPLTRLAPGESTTHTETWELFESLDQDFIPARAVQLIQP